MSVKAEKLTFDIFYASEQNDDRDVAKITLVFFDTETGQEVLTSTLIREGSGENAVYRAGQQTIYDAGDETLVKVERYFRKVNKALFQPLANECALVFASGLNSQTTWMGVHGLRIASAVSLSSLVSPDALK